MSVKHPIISVTGSSGAGTTSVKHTFDRIFEREGIKATSIEGDAFHRYDRADMKSVMQEEAEKGNHHFSHFGPEANRLGVHSQNPLRVGYRATARRANRGPGAVHESRAARR